MTDHLRTFKMWIHLLSPFTIPSMSLQLSNDAIIRGLRGGRNSADIHEGGYG